MLPRLRWLYPMRLVWQLFQQLQTTSQVVVAADLVKAAPVSPFDMPGSMVEDTMDQPGDGGRLSEGVSVTH